VAGCALERDERAHRVTDEHRLGDAGRVEQLGQPVGECFDAAQGCAGGQAVSRQVRHQHMLAGRGQEVGDAQPGVVIVGSAVQAS